MERVTKSELQGYRVWYREQCPKSPKCRAYVWKQGLVIDRHPITTAIMMDVKGRIFSRSELLIHDDQEFIIKFSLLCEPKVEEFYQDTERMRGTYVGKNKKDLPPGSVKLTQCP